LKSLEVSEEKANQRVEEFKRQLKSLTGKLKEAENRAELAEKTVKKLQKEVDRLEGKSRLNIKFFTLKFLHFDKSLFFI
jgi:tropomyosin 1